MSSFEEDETKEVDADYEDSDNEDYVPHICVRNVQYTTVLLTVKLW